MMKDILLNRFAAPGRYGYNGFGLPSTEVGFSRNNRNRIGGSSSVKEEKNIKHPRDIVSISESARKKALELSRRSDAAADHPASSADNPPHPTSHPDPAVALKAYSKIIG